MQEQDCWTTAIREKLFEGIKREFGYPSALLTLKIISLIIKI